MGYINLTLFFLRNRLFKWILIISIFVLAVYFLQNIKKFAFPQLALYETTITTVAENYSLKDVENNVTNPIEEKLDTIGGIKRYTSSSYENFSSIYIEVDRESDIYEVRQEIKEAIDEITDFPSEVKDRPKITHFKVEDIPVVELGITAEDDDLGKIREHALALKEKLDEVPQISQVQKINIPDKKIWILLNKGKMLEKKITFQEVIGALDNNYLSINAGNLKNQQDTESVITLKEYRNVEDIENILVRVTKNYQYDDGVLVKIKDIGVVQEGFKDQTSLVRFNNKPGAGLNVVKKKNIDTIEGAEVVLKAVEEYKKEINGEGVSIIVHQNDALETATRIDIASSNGIIGLVLVFVVLILFLNFKIALWTAIGIPFVFAMNIIIMQFFNLSINNISLTGIIITLGIIVDNAIIVGESVYRFKKMGFGDKESIVEALRSVLKPLIFALFTTVLSFLSMFFIPGVIGDFAVEIPLVVIFMLTASFLESTVILPTHLTTIKFNEKRRSIGEVVITRISFLYKKTLRLLLKKPLLSVIGVVSAYVIAGAIAGQYTSFFLFPTDQAYKVQITGKSVNKNISKEALGDVVTQVEKIINSLPEEGIVASYKSTVGGEVENQFTININLISYFERNTTAEEVKDYIFSKIRNNQTLNLSNLDYYIDGGGPPQGKPVEINILGFSDENRRKVADDIIQKLQEREHFTQVQDNFDEGKKSYYLDLKDSAYYALLNPAALVSSVRFAIGGIVVNEINQGGDDVEIGIKLDEEKIEYDNFLDGIFIWNNLNQLVEAKNFFDIREENVKSVVNHRNGDRVNTVSANFSPNDISANEVNDFLEQEILPMGQKYADIKLSLSGEAAESAKTFNQFLIAIFVSIVGIYFLLVLQFNHFFQPFIVIASIPFGIIGIVVAFAIQGMDLSLLAMIGILGFGGVVINASLIMVDFINSLKNEEYSNIGVDEEDFYKETQKDLKKTIIFGANLRLRPILITTLTTLIGIMPTAYGFGGKTDSTISPMTMTMFWGLLFGTLAGLYLIPILYFLNESLTSKIKKIRRKVLK